MNSSDFELTRNAAGRLVLAGADGAHHEGVVPVRAFPISAPEEGVSLLGEDGHELRWIDSLSRLPEAMRLLIETELAQRDFMPEITCIERVSSFATPRSGSRWLIQMRSMRKSC